MDLRHYLEGQEFLKTVSFLFSWALVILTFSTQRILSQKAPDSAQAWKLLLIGISSLCLSISMEWLGVVEVFSFLQWLPIIKSIRLIGVTFLGLGLYKFLQE